MVGVVVHLLHYLGRAEAGAGEAVFAPERRLVHRVNLDDEAEGLVLVHLVLTTRQRGIVRDPGVEVGRYGQDHSACLDANIAVRQHRCTGFVPLHRSHGCVEEDVVTEGLRHADRYLLHSADHSLVEDEVLVDEVGERTCGSGHEYGLQGRERVGGLGEHATGDEEADVVTCLASSD